MEQIGRRMITSNMLYVEGFRFSPHHYLVGHIENPGQLLPVNGNVIPRYTDMGSDSGGGQLP